MTPELRLKELSIEIGNKCYLNCKHCSSEAGEKQDVEISLHTLYRLINEGKEMGANLLTISGGEPLLHPGIFKFARYAFKNGYLIKLYTCGVYKVSGKLSSISNETLEQIKQSRINTLIFSLHGMRETHDFITSVKGSYDIVIKSIKRAVDFGINVEIHTVPMKPNYREIPNVISEAEKLGVNRVSLLRLVPQGRLLENLSLQMTSEDHNEFASIVNDLNKDNRIRLGAPFSCLFPGKTNACAAGKNKLLIGFNGDAYPCEAFKTKLKGMSSNIYEMTLQDIWKSDKMLNIIRNINVANIEVCNRCNLSNTCKGGCHGERLIQNGCLTIGPDPICHIQ